VSAGSQRLVALSPFERASPTGFGPGFMAEAEPVRRFKRPGSELGSLRVLPGLAYWPGGKAT